MPRVSNQRLAIRQSPHHVVTYILIVSCLVPGCVTDSCTNSSFKCCRVDKIDTDIHSLLASLGGKQRGKRSELGTPRPRQGTSPPAPPFISGCQIYWLVYLLQHVARAKYSRWFAAKGIIYPSTVCRAGLLMRSNIKSRNFLPPVAISPGLRASMPITRPALKSPRSACATCAGVRRFIRSRAESHCSSV